MKSFRKISAFLVAIMLVLITPMLAVFADTIPAASGSSATQIGKYYEADDNSGALASTPGLDSSAAQQSYSDGQVLVNKIISGTDTENVFDVTLEVQTKYRIEEQNLSEDAAAVIVVDTSYSMDTDKRMSAARKAAQAFINSFATDGANRKVAIVKFSGYENQDVDGATTVQAWTNASSLKTANEKTLCTPVNSLKAD